jgi:DNA-binding NarL/FixJ family response regulator
VDVLRLVADGWDTNDIAEKLCCSVRTVKNVVYTLTNRLKLRNRVHAVAYAMQAGVL